MPGLVPGIHVFLYKEGLGGRDKPGRDDGGRVSRLHFEDFQSGAIAEYGPRLVTREDIVAFAAEFDPQPMHLDEEAGRATMLGGLAASGWHTCCLMMRMAVDGFAGNSTSMGAPGVDEVKWLKLLRPGTNMTLRTTILETRTSRSRPDRGFVKMRWEACDETGEVLTTLTASMIFERRTAMA